MFRLQFPLVLYVFTQEQGHLQPQSCPGGSHYITNKCPIQESCSSSYEDEDLVSMGGWVDGYVGVCVCERERERE